MDKEKGRTKENFLNPKAAAEPEPSPQSGELEKENKIEEGSPIISEIIAKYIIDKLISLTITEVNRTEINEKIGYHCFDFVKKIVSPAVHAEYIPYDRDDLMQNPDNNDEVIFFDNVFYGYNSWVEVAEPKKLQYDRNASSLIKVIQQKNINTNVTADNTTSSNFQGALQGGTRVSGTTASLPSVIPENPNVIHEVRHNATAGIPSRTVATTYGVGPTQGNSSNKGSTNEKRRKNEVPDLPSYDIESLKKKEEDPEEIVLARIEKEKEVAKKNEEEVKKQQETKEKERTINIVENRAKREFDTKKFTFDTSGNVIPLKFFAFEKLGTNEFLWPKPVLKDVSETIAGHVIKAAVPGEEPPVKETKNPKGKIVKNEQKEREKENPKKQETKEIKEIKDFKDSPFIQKGSTVVPVKQGEPIVNTNISTNTGGNISNQNKNANINFFANFNINKDTYPYPVEKVPIQPAGSNFDIMIPETGVIIRDENKKKIGDMDFGHKYNKFSIGEYNKMMTESIPSLNASMIKKGMISSALPDTYNFERSYGFTDNNQLSSNPLIQSGGKIISGGNEYINHYANTGSSLMMSSNTNPLMGSKRIYNSMTMDTMKLSSKLTMSLRSAMETMDQIPEFEEKTNEDVAEPVDIFKSKLYKRKDEGNLDMVNDFNSSIIKNPNWGGPGAYKDFREYFKKPAKPQFEKELGWKIVKTKLPRSRKFNVETKSGY